MLLHNYHNYTESSQIQSNSTTIFPLDLLIFDFSIDQEGLIRITDEMYQDIVEKLTSRMRMLWKWHKLHKLPRRMPNASVARIMESEVSRELVQQETICYHDLLILGAIVSQW